MTDEDGASSAPITIEIIGSDGITRRLRFRDPETGVDAEFETQIDPEGNGLSGPGMHVLAAPEQAFWADIEAKFHNCKTTLATLGLNGNDLDGGTLGGFEHAAIYSDLWYASRIGKLCLEVLEFRHSEERLSTLILLKILEIGAAYRDWEWRHGLSKAVHRGSDTLRAARRGADSRRDDLQQDTAARLERMRQIMAQHPGKGVAWVADRAWKDGCGKSAGANRALWYRHASKYSK